MKKLIFNLRTSRIFEFQKIFKRETQKGWFAVVVKITQALVFHKPLPKQIVKQRYKTCLTCPVFDKATKSCRNINPLTEEEFGCGCYVPFLVQTNQNCWGWDFTKGQIGWQAAKTEGSEVV